MDAYRTAQHTARAAYGRLVAYLAVRSHDIATAEDALSEAFLAALETWPQRGVPDQPEAWLLAIAKRKLIDRARHRQVHTRVTAVLKYATELECDRTAETSLNSLLVTLPDRRLQLLFVCAHPALDARIHTPLMLQTVLGLNAAQIASAFLVAPATMGQRLVRAKAKIRDSGLRFELPQPAQFPDRLSAVLEAIYAAYGTGWAQVEGADVQPKGLAQEAIWLARLLVDLLPQAAEAKGLLALMLFCEARRPARRDGGRYVPLEEQDTTRWSKERLIEAEKVLCAAAQQQQLGRFQLEAAIQSAHVQRRLGGWQTWDAIAQLYTGLIQIAPTIGAQVSRAAAIARAQSPQAGLKVLDALPVKGLDHYQPYWCLKAHLLQQLQQQDAAQKAFNRAIGLCEDPAIRAFLQQQAQQC
ncbi:MAG: DUF6596 domain-containing protein [Cyanobacteria bacterium J06632_22]